MNYLPMLAAVSGEGMINFMLWLLVIFVCLVIVWLLGKKVLTVLEAGAKAFQIWDVLFYILGSLALINLLLSLVGHSPAPFYK